MKYIRVDWPEIQDYMHHPGYPDEVGFDSKKNCWFIPEEWEEHFEYNTYEELYSLH